MLPDWVSNPRPLTYESGVLPIALRGPALCICKNVLSIMVQTLIATKKYHKISKASYKGNKVKIIGQINTWMMLVK